MCKSGPSRPFDEAMISLGADEVLGEDTAARAPRGWHGSHGTSGGRLVMRSSSLPMLRGAAWVYVGSLATIGTIALFALCFSLLTMAVQLVAALLQDITSQLG